MRTKRDWMKRYSGSNCQICCPNCGVNTWKKSCDDDDNPTWLCNMCGHTEPRQVRQSAKSKRLNALMSELLKEGE